MDGPLRYRIVALRLCAALIVVGAAAACGGGGGGGGGSSPGGALLPSLAPRAVPTAVVTAPPAATGRAPATFRVVIPAAPSAASAGRSPRYISSATKSVGFTLLKTDAAGATTGTMQLFPVDATQSYCSSTTAGLACSLNVSAPVGNDIYVATTFSDTAGTQRIGSGAVSLSVAQNATNSASLTLGGSIASVSVIADAAGSSYYSRLLYGATPSPAPTGSGTPYPYTTSYVASGRLYVLGLDTNKNAIVAPDNFSSPVTLTVVPSYNYGYGYGSNGRSVTGLQPNPTPPPTSTPAPVTPSPTATPVPIVITVVHRDGSSASSAATNSVQVTAPDDVVTVTPASGTKGVNTIYVGVQATVGSVSSPIVTYDVQPALCADNYTGVQPNCVASTPAPLTACPAGQFVYGTPGYYQYCTTRTFGFTLASTNPGPNIALNQGALVSPTPPALPFRASSLQFPSIGDKRTVTLSLTANDPADTGYVVFSPVSGPCATNLTFSPALYTQVSAPTPTPAPTSAPSTSPQPPVWQLSVALNSTASITAGFQCVITANDPYGTLSAQLTINVNNLTGVTIQ